ncbi:MAG: hypothetical protein UZ03_NOB001000002, partial [Nitrospira sp. OLB3]
EDLVAGEVGGANAHPLWVAVLRNQGSPLQYFGGYGTKPLTLDRLPERSEGHTDTEPLQILWASLLAPHGNVLLIHSRFP